LREAINHKRSIPAQHHIVISRCPSAFRHKARSCPGIFLKKAGEAEDDSWDGHKVESPTPAELVINYSTDNKSESAAHWNRRTENGHDAASHLGTEQICQDRWGCGPIPTLADSNKDAGEE
jgi:hypothetical protein